MQETDFILQNKDKWKEFEDVLKSKNKDPERITDLFIETTDDLSYSRTYYPNRSVRLYLNGIAQQIYQFIYKNRTGEKKIFSRFWLEDLPTAMWFSRKALLWSFLLFAAGLSIGILSSVFYPEFARIILGDYYIEMTESNIANGDPMAVYKDEEPLLMFFKIAWNNIRIAFGTFVLGLLFGIGTVYVVFYNAIMFGAFIYFFIERGLFRESFFAVMLHGTLELSMIVIAGCAGFTLARGLLFPGTFTRGQALIHSARNGIKILVGVTVLLIYAAIIESFATRYTEMPDIIRGIIILLSFIIVFGYFVLYPWHMHRKGLIGSQDHEEIPSPIFKNYNLHKIKSAGKIFTDTFSLFAANSRKIALISLATSSIITIAFAVFTQGNYHQIFDVEESYSRNPLGPLYVWDAFHYHLNFAQWPLSLPLFAILFTLYSAFVYNTANKQFSIVSHLNFSLLLNVLFISFVIATPLLLPPLFCFLSMVFIFPLGLMWIYVTFRERSFFITSFVRTIRILRGNFLKMLGTFLSTFAIQWIVLFIISSDIISLLTEFVSMNIPRYSWFALEGFAVIQTFVAFYVLSFILCLPIYGTSLLYYSLREINEASSLVSAIEKIGFKKRAYGLEQES